MKLYVTAPPPASTLQLNVVVPVAWFVESGGLWQSVQAKARARAPAVRCARCAPTAGWVVRVSPAVPTGGIAAMLGSVPVRSVSPWQLVQVIVVTLTTPLRWAVALTVVAV